jgi:hypothetical protein
MYASAIRVCEGRTVNEDQKCLWLIVNSLSFSLPPSPTLNASSEIGEHCEIYFIFVLPNCQDCLLPSVTAMIENCMVIIVLRFLRLEFSVQLRLSGMSHVEC